MQQCVRPFQEAGGTRFLLLDNPGEDCSGAGGFSWRRTAVGTKEEAAASRLRRGLRPDMRYETAGDIKSNKSDNLNSLVRGYAKGAVGVGMTSGVAVDHLHNSNHQHERDADDPDKGHPCGA